MSKVEGTSVLKIKFLFEGVMVNSKRILVRLESSVNLKFVNSSRWFDSKQELSLIRTWSFHFMFLCSIRYFGKKRKDGVQFELDGSILTRE